MTDRKPSPTIEETIALLAILHAGQRDWTGEDYWHHPVAVMNRMHPLASDEDRLIALLHDVLEDCEDTIAALLNIPFEEADFRTRAVFLYDLGYSDYVVRGVMLDSRIDGQFLHYKTGDMVDGTYHAYILNLIASDHLGCMLTKLADNEHNSDPERIAKLPEDKRIQAEQMSAGRYARSKKALRQALAAKGIT